METPLQNENDPDFGVLYDTPSVNPGLLPKGEWIKNWFSNMKPYEKPHVREDKLIGYTVEHEYHIDRENNPILKEMLSQIGTIDRYGRKNKQQDINGRLVKAFWKAAKGDGLILDEEKLTKCGLPKTWLDHPEMSHVNPEGKKVIYIHIDERKDWHTENVKFEAIAPSLKWKFQKDTLAWTQLMATGRDEIVEWNNWNDTNFGRSVQSGEGQNQLGRMLMAEREEHRKLGNIPTEEQMQRALITMQPEGRFLEALHKDILTEELQKIGEEFKKLDSNRLLGTFERETYKKKTYVTMVGTREIEKDPFALGYMEWAAYTLAETGCVIRSGGAEGADGASYRGAIASKAGVKAIEIVHPYDRPSKGSADVGNYVLKDREYKTACADLSRALTENFDGMTSYQSDLQVRNVAQVLGKDGTTPSSLVLYIAPELENYKEGLEEGFIMSGTRFAVYTNRLLPKMGIVEKAIPQINLRRSEKTYYKEEIENFRKVVVTFANNERAKEGLTLLPDDYSPSHAEYLKERKTKYIAPPAGMAFSPSSKTKKYSEDEKHILENTRIYIKNMIAHAKAHFSDPDVPAVFSKIDEKKVLTTPLTRDHNVILLIDKKTPGKYYLINENEIEITNDRDPDRNATIDMDYDVTTYRDGEKIQAKQIFHQAKLTLTR